MILRGESENYHILCINYDQNIILRRVMIQMMLINQWMECQAQQRAEASREAVA